MDLRNVRLGALDHLTQSTQKNTFSGLLPLSKTLGEVGRPSGEKSPGDSKGLGKEATRTSTGVNCGRWKAGGVYFFG